MPFLCFYCFCIRIFPLWPPATEIVSSSPVAFGWQPWFFPCTAASRKSTSEDCHHEWFYLLQGYQTCFRQLAQDPHRSVRRQFSQILHLVVEDMWAIFYTLFKPKDNDINNKNLQLLINNKQSRIIQYWTFEHNIVPHCLSFRPENTNLNQKCKVCFKSISNQVLLKVQQKSQNLTSRSPIVCHAPSLKHRRVKKDDQEHWKKFQMNFWKLKKMDLEHWKVKSNSIIFEAQTGGI